MHYPVNFGSRPNEVDRMRLVSTLSAGRPPAIVPSMSPPPPARRAPLVSAARPGGAPSPSLGRAGDVALPAGVSARDVERAAAAFLGRYGPRTLATYRQKLRVFADWLGVPFDQLPAALLVRGPAAATLAVEEFRAHLIATLAARPGQGRGRDDRPAPATVNGYLAAVRSLVRFLARAHLCHWQLAVDDEPVVPYRDTRGPGVAAVRQLRQAAAAGPPGSDPRLAARDAAALALLTDLALRRSELLALAVGDVERDAAGRPVRLRIVGKGRLDGEFLSLPPRTAESLRPWLDVRRALDAPPVGRRDTRPLFVALDRGAGRGGRRDPRTGEPRVRPPLARLTPQALARRLAVLGERAGVGPVRPHALRHTAITALLEHGQSLRDVQRFARHRDPRTTIRYDDAVRDVAGTLAGALGELYATGAATPPDRGSPDAGAATGA